MSIPVTLADLPTTLAQYPWGYLVTVGPALRAHSLAVPTHWSDGALHATVGRSTRANVAERPEITMIFPHPQPDEYRLIVDGTATVADAVVVFTPSSAVLHRPAL